jgi:hypothetical protein
MIPTPAVEIQCLCRQLWRGLITCLFKVFFNTGVLRLSGLSSIRAEIPRLCRQSLRGLITGIFNVFSNTEPQGFTVPPSGRGQNSQGLADNRGEVYCVYIFCSALQHFLVTQKKEKPDHRQVECL